MLNLAIRNGSIIDGTGSPPVRADVGINGDRIAAVGRVERAEVEIDATGRIVSPGFVDPHSHSDWTLHANRDAHSTIRQGVTTEIVGNCGITNAPVSSGSRDTATARLRDYGYQGEVSWSSFGEYLADVERDGTSQNLAFFVGHSTLREAAGVTGNEPPDEEASAAMDRYVSEAMDAGVLMSPEP